MAYWLVKSEPFVYSWDQLVIDGRTPWEGVRNYAARLHLRAMKMGDRCLFYHSNKGTEIVGIAEVCREAYPDTTTTEDWSAVDIKPVRALKKPVTLAEVKARPELAGMALIRLGRLSVQPVTPEEWTLIMRMAGEKGK
jgi:predicted RNA-binding protein with PUA-like domain